jgi:hypothetical protein
MDLYLRILVIISRFLQIPLEINRDRKHKEATSEYKQTQSKPKNGSGSAKWITKQCSEIME